MTVGISAAFAGSRLNVYRGTNHTGITPYVKLHIGDPGANGTANVSAVVTRNAATFNAPSGPSMSLSALAAFSMTTSETITHISFWDASTAGNFQESAVLTASVPVINGSTLTFSSLTITESPAAA